MKNFLGCVLVVCLMLLLPAMSDAAGGASKNADVTGEIKAAAEALQNASSAGMATDLQQLLFRNYQELKLKQEANKLTEIVILSVLTLSSLLVVLFFLKPYAHDSPSLLLNATGLIFIVSGTIILTLMADTDAQLTAAIGILGAVAGYLFGSMRRPGPTDHGEAKN